MSQTVSLNIKQSCVILSCNISFFLTMYCSFLQHIVLSDNVSFFLQHIVLFCNRSFFLAMHRSLCQCIVLAVNVSFFLAVYRSVWHCINLSGNASFFLAINRSFCQCIILSGSISFCMALYHSFWQCIVLSGNIHNNTLDQKRVTTSTVPKYVYLRRQVSSIVYEDHVQTVVRAWKQLTGINANVLLIIPDKTVNIVSILCSL